MDKFVSQQELKHRDVVMVAVRKRIYERRLPASAIVLPSGRRMSTKARERILRDDFDFISLRKAYQIASAVGVKTEMSAA